MALPSDNGVFIHKGRNCSPNFVPSAQSIPISTTDNTSVKNAIDEVVADMEDTSEANAMKHLGFYLDANGGLCQVNSI